MAVSYMTEDGYNKILAEINYLETCRKMQNMMQQRRLRVSWKRSWPS